jgi:Holliday junction resolvase RusA-like endonuclease
MNATINKLPKTHNDRLRSHWRTQRRETKDWVLMVRAACGLPQFGKVQGRCKVTITLYRKRLQDPDNAVASVKPVLDALVRNGWLVDDSAEYLELHVKEEKSKEQRTVIEWSVCDGTDDT